MRRRLGLRREIAILLPLAFLVLVGLATFTLFSYRSAIERLVDERQQEAARRVRHMAAELEAGRPSVDSLRRMAPRARGIALLDRRGIPLAQVGAFADVDLLSPVRDGEPTRAIGVGPNREIGDVVAGIVPVGPAQDRSYLRADFPADALAAQRRALPVLTVLVLSVSAALLGLVLLFLRHLLEPYESLLERARKVATSDQLGVAMDDEVAFLLATFDRALGALTKPAEGSTEEDMRALERTLAPSLESGVLLLDPEGRLLTLNPTGRALLELADQPPRPGMELETALAPHSDLTRLLSRSVESGRSVQRQECGVKVRGKSLTLGLTVQPLRRESGAVRGYLVLFADLTQVKQRTEERRLAESLAQIGELTAGVAHELRNSLASLRGYLTLIERRKDEGSVAESLHEIRHEADHLQRVLEDFLSFARPGTVRLQEVDLERVLRRAAADPALGGARVRIQGTHQSQLPTVRGDPQLLERALRNLLHNAVQAQREVSCEDEVAARLSLLEEEMELVVEDRGSGLPRELRDKLFVPFATGTPGGVGLGLALAHRIVALHGGRLRLEDREAGGTRAVLLFPLATFVTKRNRSDSPSSHQGL